MDKLVCIKNKSKIHILENITEQLYYKIEDSKKFFDVNNLIVKLFLKNPELIEKAKDKVNLDIFNEKILESNEKLIKWFINS